jgi:hypothetical protein
MAELVSSPAFFPIPPQEMAGAIVSPNELLLYGCVNYYQGG